MYSDLMEDTESLRQTLDKLLKSPEGLAAIRFSEGVGVMRSRKDCILEIEAVIKRHTSPEIIAALEECIDEIRDMGE